MDISIIVCSYNPEERVFSRCLKAISLFNISGLSTELIIIDNNSLPSLSERLYVKQQITAMPFPVKIVTEKEQGLAYARIKGFKNASANLIMMCDDDNEPESEYLRNAISLFKLEKDVGIIGPGIVTVQYIDPTPNFIKNNLGIFFQEKHICHGVYTKDKTLWHEYYPPGTGQVIVKDVVKKYISFFETGKISATDRKGDSLASAGDNQLIWSSLYLNKKVGLHPTLKINHIIAGKRSNMNYLRRLSFALRSSGYIAFAEMYPDKKEDLIKYRWYKYIYHHFNLIAKALLQKKTKMLLLDMAALNGAYEAGFYVNNRPIPLLPALIIKYLKRK
jgi:glycosyltransferase involved in cell wall biosynthesis